MGDNMKTFISWSGLRSRAVAEALRDWLPMVIQQVEPWMSGEDIDIGTRWSSNLASQLQGTNVGVICLTSDNIDSPWILFEAGALSKALEKSYVCPYILDFEITDLEGPLVQFQATKANKDGTNRLVRTMNNALGTNAVNTNRLDATFEKWWPNLEKELEKILNSPKIEVSQKSNRNDREILGEILELVRNINRDQNVDVDKATVERHLLEVELKSKLLDLQLKQLQVEDQMMTIRKEMEK